MISLVTALPADKYGFGPSAALLQLGNELSPRASALLGDWSFTWRRRITISARA
jgi:hypothetical protein